jgi:hypothetical protein
LGCCLLIDGGRGGICGGWYATCGGEAHPASADSAIKSRIRGVFAPGLIVLGIKYLIDHWDLVKEKTGEVVEKIKDFVGGVKDFIVDKFKALGEWIIENHPLLRLFRAIRDYAPTLIEKFASIGSDLVDGLKQGISDSWNSFKTWLTDKLGDPIKWAKKALGIVNSNRFLLAMGNMMGAIQSGTDQAVVNCMRFNIRKKHIKGIVTFFHIPVFFRNLFFK